MSNVRVLLREGTNFVAARFKDGDVKKWSVAENGALFLYDFNNNTVATFASGCWAGVERSD